MTDASLLAELDTQGFMVVPGFLDTDLTAAVRAHIDRLAPPIAPAALPEARNALGNALREQGRLSEAEAEYREAVHLTPNEFRLLEALVKNAGRVLTHRQLLKEVWGPGSVEDTHYVRVYMNQLRQKLEVDAARPQYLLTEPVAGHHHPVCGQRALLFWGQWARAGAGPVGATANWRIGVGGRRRVDQAVHGDHRRNRESCCLNTTHGELFLHAA